MKKIIYTIIIFHLTLLISNAQWISAAFRQQSDSFHHVSFINNRYTGWACGRRCILKTTNRETIGLFIIHPVNKPMSKEYFQLIPILFIVWDMFETILKSTNGGETG